MKLELSDFKFIKAISDDDKVGTIRLDGSFGFDIDGPSVAAEINFLDKIIGVDEIHIHINTPGGVVFDSLSVAGAILEAKADTHAHNDGLCMSAGFHVFLSCDFLHAFDFAAFMYHGPRNPDTGEMASENEFVDTINKSMITLIANRLNKKEDEVAEMLDGEEFVMAKDFKKTFGLPIKIKTSKRKPNIKASMTIEQVVAEYSNFNFNLNDEEMPENKLDVSKVLAKLELDADIANPMAKIEAKVDALLASKSSLEAANKTLTEKNESLNAELEKHTADEAVAYVEKLVRDEMIKKDAKDKIIASYKKNPESVKAIFDSMPAPSVTASISDASLPRDEAGKIKMEMTDGDNPVPKDYLWYSKNEPKVLAEMESKDPEKFNFLLDKYIA